MQHEVIKALHELLAGKRSTARASYTIRSKATFPELLEVYALFDALSPHSQEMLCGGMRANSWGEIASIRRPPSTGKLQRAITCATALFRSFESQIDRHREYRDKFEAAVLNSSAEEATKILDAHRADVGCTLWELHWRIALVDLVATDLERKKFVELIHNAADGSLTSAVVRILSYLFDRSFPPGVIRNSISNLYQDLDPVVKSMFELVVLGDWSEDVKLMDLIEIIEIFPLVDRSWLFHRLATKILSGEESEERRFILRSLARVSALRGGPDFKMVLDLLEPNADNPPIIHDDCSRIWDWYARGEYSMVISYVSENAEAFGADLAAIELLVKSKIYLNIAPSNSDGLRGQLESILHGIYARTDDYEKCLQDLDRFILKYPFKSLSHQLKAVLEAQTRGYSSSLNLRAALSANRHSPRLLENTDLLKENQIYINVLEADKSTSTFLRFFKNSSDLSLTYEEAENWSIPTPRAAYFLGLYSYKKGLYNQSIDHLTKFIELCKLDNEHGLASFAIAEANILLVNVYAKMENIREALKFLIKTYLDYPQSIKYTLIRKIYELSKFHREATCSLVEYPIAASLAADDPHEVSMALRRFMRAEGVAHPHELATKKSAMIEQRLLLYLLYRVCTVDVLDSLPVLDQQEKVEQERLVLLNYVGEKFPHLARNVETEKLRLIQESQLRAALDRIDENKVVLNLSSLREAEAIEFSEIFANYRSQRELAESQVKSDINAAIERISISSPKIVIVDTQTADRQIFKSYGIAFKAVRKLFLDSPHFGLEACLSGKIRHGILVEHLLKPLKSRHIFLTREKAQRQDVIGYWENIYSNYDDKQIAERIVPIFEALTNKVATVAREVKEKWIQARTETKSPDGLFDYSFDEQALRRVYQKNAEEDHDVQRFLDNIFLALSARTRVSLENIRNRIGDDLRPPLTQAFNEAISAVQPIVGAQWVRTVLVAGRQETESACDEMIRWFEGASGAMAEDFDLDLVGATAIGMVEKLHPEIKDRHSLIVDADFRVKGKHFDSLVHMLFFVLENGIKHSSVPLDAYECAIKIKAKGNHLAIRVQNPTCDDVTASDAVSKINARISELENDLDPAKVIREGGSGFAKIIATVIYELDNVTPRIVATRSEQDIIIQIETKAERLIA